MKPLSDEQKAKLSAKLRQSAERCWSKSESGLYTLAMHQDTALDLSQAFFTPAKPELQRVGLTQIFQLNHTTKTDVFWGELANGQQIALRHGPAKGYAKRSACPMNLQNYKDWNDEDSRIKKLEALPLVAMDNLDYTMPDDQVHEAEIPDIEIIIEIMHYLATKSGFGVLDEELLERDLAILPNGLPVRVDPDCFDDPLNENETNVSVGHFIELQNKLNLPDELRWINQNGVLTQDRFFPNPFEPN